MREACITQYCDSIADIVIQMIFPEWLTHFLRTNFVETPYFVFGYWSLVHTISGFLWGFVWSKLLSKSSPMKGFYAWIVISLVFEAFEYGLGFGGRYPSLFHEPVVDIIWDLVFNFVGYWIYIKVFHG